MSRIKTGSFKTTTGHVISYTQTSHVGFFDTIAETETSYSCECGNYSHTPTRALKAHAATHDSWRNISKKEADRADLAELLSQLI